MHYLDNAATSWPKPESVYRTLDESFRGLFSPKRGTAKASRLGADRLREARETLARLFNISQPERILFTGGCTQALNIAIQAFPWQAGDGVIISAVEHHALSRPVRKMAREKDIAFYVVPYRDDSPFDVEACERLLQEKPQIRMVATTHASNVIGSVLPIERIGTLARRYGKIYLVDAAQTAGVLDVDTQRCHIDLLALPGHKSLYGPPGVGALYIGENIRLNTFMEGGTGNDSGKHAMRPEPPDGFEVGTIPLPQILAMAEGVRWVLETGLSTIHRHETALLERLLTGLQSLPEVRIYGHTEPTLKTPVVSFNVAERTPEAVGQLLFEQAGIALRTGFHCAPMAHEAIGTLERGGTIRASIGYYTTPEDVDALLTALKEILTTESLRTTMHR